MSKFRNLKHETILGAKNITIIIFYTYMVTIAADISMRYSRKMSGWNKKGDRPLVARLNLSKFTRRSMARKSIWFLIRVTAPSRDRQLFHLFNDVTPAGVGNIAHSRKYREKRKPGGKPTSRRNR